MIAQNGVKSDSPDKLDVGTGTSAMLADTLSRWKYSPKKFSQLNVQTEVSDDDRHSSKNTDSEASVGSGPSAKPNRTLNRREFSDPGNGQAEPSSSEEEAEELSEESEYEPSSESSDGEWLSKDAAKRETANKKQAFISRQETELRTYLKAQPARHKLDVSKAKSSLELLRKLRQERLKRREKQLGIELDSSGDEWRGDRKERETKKSKPPVAGQQSSVKSEPTLNEDDFMSGVLRSRQILLSDDDEDEPEEGVGDGVAKSENAVSKNGDMDADLDLWGSTPKVKRRRVVVASDNSDSEDKKPAPSVPRRPPTVPIKLTKPVERLEKNTLRANCLKFFQTASEEELEAVPRCTNRMAKLIMEARPFTSFGQMIDEFESRKGISSLVCDAYMEMLQVRHSLDCILYECQQISSQLEPQVERLKRCADGDLIEKPSIMNDSLELKPYQIVGFNWLVLLMEQKFSAVLADEMVSVIQESSKVKKNIFQGLGKTVQVITFLAYLKEQGVSQPSLIVVPSSTLDNWLRELNRWCPALSVFTYYGSVEDRGMLRRSVEVGESGHFDVVLTTYKLVSGSAEDRAFQRRLNINYAIFDEAHMLKSCRTARYKTLMNIRAKRRLLLTGTPLQNNLVELVSLMHFVMPELFVHFVPCMKKLLASFETKNLSQFEESKIEQAKQIMRPFTLRRLKAEVLDQLPEKHERLEMCELTETQSHLYRQLVSMCDDMLTNDGQGGGDQTGRSSGSLCSMFMQLRKAANHPLLLRHRYDDKKVEKIANVLFKTKKGAQSYEALLDGLLSKNDFELHSVCAAHKKLSRMKLPISAVLNSGKIAAMDRLLPEFKSQGSKVLIFSQFTMVLDVLEAYLKHKKYIYVRLDGSTPVVERQGLIDHFNSSDEVFLFLLSTRAGGLGINLTSANVIILHDIDFNPHNDRQAEDRCHRVGQTKDVHVIKLICKDTIDESMLACAKRKLLLEQRVTADDEQQNCDQDVESILRDSMAK